MAPNTDFDTYMGTVRAAGAQPIIIVNYGSSTPDDAAAWVRYANVTKGYGAKYWEIGNEVYGNGEYGATCETDNHSSHSATTYATNLLQYVSAMKAVDPSIKVGAVLKTPGAWPDGIVGPGDTQDWNHTVMSIAGSKIDFVIVHHYPNSTSEADLLTKPQAEIPRMASTLHSLINQFAGVNAANVGIAVTEANANAYKDTAPNGLFAPDEYLTWMETAPSPSTGGTCTTAPTAARSPRSTAPATTTTAECSPAKPPASRPRPGVLDPARQRPGPAGAVVSAARYPFLGRRLRAHASPPRRAVLTHHHQRRGRQPALHRHRSGRAVVRSNPAAGGARHRPGPRVGRRRHLLVHDRRRVAGPRRPAHGGDVRRAAPDLVRHTGRPRAGGATPVPDRRLLVPADRRGRHRAGPRRLGRSRPHADRTVRTLPDQPDPDARGTDQAIQNTGHGDLVQAPDGSW